MTPYLRYFEEELEGMEEYSKFEELQKEFENIMIENNKEFEDNYEIKPIKKVKDKKIIYKI
jgi:hypothetical protein